MNPAGTSLSCRLGIIRKSAVQPSVRLQMYWGIAAYRDVISCGVLKDKNQFHCRCTATSPLYVPLTLLYYCFFVKRPTYNENSLKFCERRVYAKVNLCVEYHSHGGITLRRTGCPIFIIIDSTFNHAAYSADSIILLPGVQSNDPHTIICLFCSEPCAEKHRSVSPPESFLD